jgi:hypothetical protein
MSDTVEESPRPPKSAFEAAIWVLESVGEERLAALSNLFDETVTQAEDGKGPHMLALGFTIHPRTEDRDVEIFGSLRKYKKNGTKSWVEVETE